MDKFFSYVGGETTYYGIVWRDNTEYATARYDLITEIHVSVAYQMWYQMVYIIIIFKHVLERLKSFSLLGDDYKILKKILWQA